MTDPRDTPIGDISVRSFRDILANDLGRAVRDDEAEKCLKELRAQECNDVSIQAIAGDEGLTESHFHDREATERELELAVEFGQNWASEHWGMLVASSSVKLDDSAVICGPWCEFPVSAYGQAEQAARKVWQELVESRNAEILAAIADARKDADCSVVDVADAILATGLPGTQSDGPYMYAIPHDVMALAWPDHDDVSMAARQLREKEAE